MKINKPLDIDLNIISPQKHIRIHEGDVDSVDILIGVTVDDESVDLDGVTIKYDATINNYLAEQDADGSVVDDKISIPVTQNMTAMSGLLLIDVRMIQSDQILFTQTICATVEKAVVNGSTYIDLNKITIIQRMNALEEKMDYIEELVENFDTSKLIVSTNRPPSGAPAELDVDLLRVGDTWILSGASIVYKLVEAQYNYQPVSSAEPYHKFTWQPLNERYGVGNTEPPTTVTYQAVIYTINKVQWSWLPVPEYSRGDHYQMLVDGESTYYICKSGTMASTGVCTYTWREEGGGASSGITIINTETVPESAEWGDSIPASYAGNTGKAGELAYWEEDGYFWGLCSLATDPITGNINYNWVRQADEIDIDNLKSDIATKMDLAPLNPTAAQIAAMPNGQLYGDTVNHKGTIKGGQEFYDKEYVDTALNGKLPCYYITYDHTDLTYWEYDYKVPCILFRNLRNGEEKAWLLYDKEKGTYPFKGFKYMSIGLTLNNSSFIINPKRIWGSSSFEGDEATITSTYPLQVGRHYYPMSLESNSVKDIYEIVDELSASGNTYRYRAFKLEKAGTSYTKTEIDSMIPTVPTNISAFTNDSGYLTLSTLPIYDGTVI